MIPEYTELLQTLEEAEHNPENDDLCKKLITLTLEFDGAIKTKMVKEFGVKPWTIDGWQNGNETLPQSVIRPRMYRNIAAWIKEKTKDEKIS